MNTHLSQPLRPRHASPVFACALSIIVSVAFMYFVGWSMLISSQEGALTSLRKEVADAAAENQVNREVEGEEPQLRAEVERAKAAYCQAAPLVSKDSDVSQILSDIQREAEKHSVNLTGIQAFKEPVNSPQFDKLQQREYPATATGTYAGVRKFFQSVAQMNRIVVVPAFRLVSVSPRVSAGFTLIAYNAPPKVPALPQEYGSLQCAPPVVVPPAAPVR
jgi:Tfp pilus assembly protein PilO